MLETMGMRVPRMNGRWRGERVEDEIDLPFPYLLQYLPTFVRAPFGRNRLKDVIVRRDDGLPVAAVSKSYLLIQHHDVVNACAVAARRAGIDTGELRAHVALTEHGTRLALRIILPEQYSMCDADGHRMALTFECVNSVDGTVSLLALAGWFRFVCRNGLAVGTTAARVCQRHVPAGDGADFAALLADGIRAAVEDRQAFDAWAGRRVARESLQQWVDGPVARAWGVMAAARVHGIAQSGFDGEPARKPKVPAHLRTVSHAIRVPGSRLPCDNCYAAAQILAWVASRRHNVAERTAWRAQIGGLVQGLVAST
jgi:hypothetical protein